MKQGNEPWDTSTFVKDMLSRHGGGGMMVGEVISNLNDSTIQGWAEKPNFHLLLQPCTTGVTMNLSLSTVHPPRADPPGPLQDSS